MAIKGLDYQPNMMARGLATRSTDTIALVVDYSNEETYGNEFFLKIQFGLERELARHGYFLMIVNISGEKEVPDLMKKIVLEERVDGIVLLNEMARAPVIDLLLEAQVPFVVAGRGERADTSWVDIDNVHGGYAATKKLIECGASHIGFITNSFDKRFVSERFLGFKKALKENNLSCNQKFVVAGQSTYQDQLTYLSKNIDTVCDAYVVTDSSLAYYFIKALSAVGFSVPNDVQIVAFDNQLLSQISEPGMTVVDIDVTELGERVAKILLDRLQQHAEERWPIQELLDVRIIERGSTL